MILRRKFATKKAFDLVVIGGGPGGYVAAIKASQLGLRSVCIDSRDQLGGTSFHAGCIPSKFLLSVAQKYSQVLQSERFGVFCDRPSYNWLTVQLNKQNAIKKLAKDVDSLFEKSKVQRITGTAAFRDSQTLLVTHKDGRKEELTASHYLIATGSHPTAVKGIKIDDKHHIKHFLSSTGMLSIPSVPKTLTVIGAGVTGLELGSVFQAFGTQVTFIERADTILPGMDQDVVLEYQRFMVKEGFKFVFNVNAVRGEVDPQSSETIIHLEDRTSKAQSEVASDVCLVAAGRTPNTESLQLDRTGVNLDDLGRIKVNNRFHTGVASIYAIGDVIEGPMLAHKAELEGMAVAEFLAGHTFSINYEAIPSVVYTEPEIAFVGKTQAQLAQLGVPFKTGIFPMMANSRARTSLDNKPGMVKILAHRNTDRILGAHIISANAGEMITELALAMNQKASSEDVASFCHAHPTLSEAIKEAAMSIASKAIHY